MTTPPDRPSLPDRRPFGLTAQHVAWGWKLALAVFAIATAWRALEAKVDHKLDAARFEKDSARRDARWAARDSFDVRRARDMDIVVCALLPQDTRCPRK